LIKLAKNYINLKGVTLKRVIFFIIFSITLLIGADLNTTLINDENASSYQNLLKNLKKDTPEAKLQKTLIFKILNIKKEAILPIDPKKLKITDQKSFINTFLKIIKKSAKAKRFKETLSIIKEQLKDLKENISNADKNATNLLTMQLEYAYYYKKYEKLKKDIDFIENNYKIWLKNIAPNLDKLKFNTKNIDKNLKDLNKKIEKIDKKIKKLNIEKERWKILEKEKYVKNLDKEIQRLIDLKDSLIIETIKNKLILFFDSLKRKDEKIFDILKSIGSTASKLSQNKSFIKESLKEALNLYIELKFGKTKTYLYKIKEQTFSFFQNRFLNIPLYKFAMSLGIFLLFLFFRKLFTLIILKMLKNLASKTKTTIDDNILAIVEKPLKFSFVILGFYLAVASLDIESEVIDKLVRSMIILAIFWLFYDAVAVLEGGIYNFARKFGKELYREIGNFFVKTLKIFIFAVGFVAILQEWNINVSAFIASLGLGGLAFALAAKDTAANLFGGLTILADKSLKIDDWIKLEDVEGTVEDIGLRTIKVRTFEKSLITVPNQIVANNPVENFSRRNIRRIKMRIGLTYSTSKEQIDKILFNIRNMLKSHPGIDTNSTLLVNFDEFEDSSLSIFIYCFTNTANWQKYLEIKEDVNLKIMDIIEKAGAEFAFPSQSIYIEKIKK